MEQQQPRLEVSPQDLYALIGQTMVENKLLRARLAETEQRLRELVQETPVAGEILEPA